MIRVAVFLFAAGVAFVTTYLIGATKVRQVARQKGLTVPRRWVVQQSVKRTLPVLPVLAAAVFAPSVWWFLAITTIYLVVLVTVLMRRTKRRRARGQRP
jgi:ABC-type uncharacterized transport system permease subunit